APSGRWIAHALVAFVLHMLRGWRDRKGCNYRWERTARGATPGAPGSTAKRCGRTVDTRRPCFDPRSATDMLKCTLIAVLALFAVLGCPHAASAQTSTDASLLVKLAPGLTPDVQTAVIARNGGVELSSIPALRLHAVVVSVAELAAVKARKEADPLVEHVEDNLVRISEAIPPDPLYTSQWVLPQIGWGQGFGVFGVRG